MATILLPGLPSPSADSSRIPKSVLDLIPSDRVICSARREERKKGDRNLYFSDSSGRPRSGSHSRKHHGHHDASPGISLDSLHGHPVLKGGSETPSSSNKASNSEAAKNVLPDACPCQVERGEGYDDEPEGCFEPLHFLQSAHMDFVSRVRFSKAKPHLFYTVSNDSTIKCYSVSNSHPLASFVAHRAGILDMDISPDGNRLVTCSLTGSVKVWNTSTNELYRKYKIPGSSLSSSNSFSGHISGGAFGGGAVSATIRGTCIEFHPSNSNIFAVGDSAGGIHLYNLSSPPSAHPASLSSTVQAASVLTASNPLQAVQAIGANVSNAFSAVKDALIPLAGDKSQASPDQLTGVSFSATGRLLFACDAGGTLSVFTQDPSSGHYRLTTREKQHRSISQVVYCEAKKSLMATSCDNQIKLFSSPSLRLRRVYFHPHTTYSIRGCFSAGGKRFFCGAEDTAVYVYSVDGGQILHKLMKHRSAVSSVDVSPDGAYIASADYEGCVCVWTRQVPSTPLSPPSPYHAEGSLE